MKRLIIYTLRVLTVLHCGRCAAQKGEFEQKMKELDSLKKLIDSPMADSTKASRLLDLGFLYIKTGSDDTAIVKINEALYIGKKINHYNVIFTAYKYLGNIFWKKGKYNESLQNFTLQANHAWEANNLDNYGEGLSNLGNVHLEMGNYKKAMFYQYEVLKFAEKLKNSQDIATAYANIGSIYAKINDNENALMYFLKASETYLKIGDRYRLMITNGNIGSTYLVLEKPQLALKYLLLSLKESEHFENNHVKSVVLGSIGSVYGQQGDSAILSGNFDYACKTIYPKAISYFRKSLDLKQKIGDIFGSAAILHNIGKLYVNMKNYGKAEKFLTDSKIIGDSLQSKEILRDAFKTFSEMNFQTGKYKAAFDYYKKYINANDSLLNTENSKKLIQTQMQYDFDKKSEADSIKNSEVKKFEEIKHQHEISKQKTFTYSGIGGFLIMIIVAAISYIAFRNKRKATIEIEKQKHIVEEKQKEILDSIYYARRIQRALITNEKYFYKNLNRLNK